VTPANTSTIHLFHPVHPSLSRLYNSHPGQTTTPPATTFNSIFPFSTAPSGGIDVTNSTPVHDCDPESWREHY
jgi:hypothetical protein